MLKQSDNLTLFGLLTLAIGVAISTGCAHTCCGLNGSTASLNAGEHQLPAELTGRVTPSALAHYLPEESEIVTEPQQSASTRTVAMRAQSPEANGFGFPTQAIPSYTPNNQNARFGQSYQQPVVTSGNGQAPTAGNGQAVGQQTSYQYPELATPGGSSIPGNGLPSPNIGPPNELNSIIQPFERGGNATFPSEFPTNYADIDVYVTETQTGSINFGGAFNSDNGLVGQVIINEKNFDITRFPRRFRDITDGTAWRGAGQNFRLELVPGSDLQRYLVSFSEPFLFGTNYSFSASGYLFDRRYFDWNENRLGGRISVGRRLTPDLSFSLGLRMERVELDNPRNMSSDTLNDIVNEKFGLFLANAGLIRDTRDHPFLATEGTYFSATVSQAFGDFSYTRGDLDWRAYRLMYQRPDGSGRHTISYGTKLGVSGSDTPLFENYIAGGFSTMRGFDFRGVGPIEGDIRVGGQFQWLNTVEYNFPLTADDMVKGVVFCDFGTIEDNVGINPDDFRVAPGVGLRISVPGLGLGAPLAFDFAFPVATATGDEEQVFSFYLGALR
jgi:outer membrane protein insertion porin family